MHSWTTRELNVKFSYGHGMYQSLGQNSRFYFRGPEMSSAPDQRRRDTKEYPKSMISTMDVRPAHCPI